MDSDAASRRFDVFLSHNGRDKATVERVAKGLKRAGVEPWLDSWCLTPGGRWQAELTEGLAACRACAVFIGESDLGDWVREEVAVALRRAASERDFRVFPVLLPGLAEPFDASSLPPFLATRTWVDLRGGATDPRGLQAFVNAVHGVPLGAGALPQPSAGVCPYLGLQSFGEEHAEFFFGRERDVQRLVEKLKGARFLAVLGPSGSGKSSLVRAGLVPALRQSALPGSERWEIRTVRPGARPLSALAAELLRDGPDRSMRATLDELASDERGLDLAASLLMAGREPDAQLLLIVDQAEEVFTLCPDEHERARFLANLVYASSVPGGRTVVVLTLRADFYPRAAAYPTFSQQASAHQFLVSPLDEDGLREAIEEPARRVGLEFEAGLVDTIIEDVHGQPGSLPLLEHALLELWQRRRGTLLTLEGYQQSGGVQRAIARRAEEVYAELGPPGQEIARRAFLRLTQPGEGTEDTRRRVDVHELVTAEDAAAAVEQVVGVLVAARMVTTGGADGADERWVEVSHEALIRGWPRLRRWLDENRAGLRLHRRITEGAEDWEHEGRDESVLLRGARLAEALEWRARDDASLNELERVFLDASAALRDRERTARRRRVRLALAGLTLAVAAIAAVAVWALAERDTALAQRRLAVARELAVESGAQRSADPALALLLAAEAVRTQAIDQTEDALRTALAETRLQTILPVARRPVRSAAFRADGEAILTASGDGKARLWERDSGRLVRTLGAGPAAETHAAFAGAGGLVLTTNRGSTTKLWDATTGRVVRELDDARDHAVGGAVNADGSQILTIGLDGEGRLWTRGRDRPRALGTVAAEAIATAAFSPDGRRLATAPNYGPVRVRPVADLARDRPLSPAGAFVAVSFTPTGRKVLGTTRDGATLQWNAAGGRRVEFLERAPTLSGADATLYPPQTLAAGLFEDGLFATGRADGALAVTDKASELRGFTTPTGGGQVRAVSVAPDGSAVVTAHEDGTARVFAVEPPADRRVAVLRGGPTAFNNVDGGPGGRLVAGADNMGAIFVWTSAGERVRRISGGPATLPPDPSQLDEFGLPLAEHHVTFAPDGKQLAITGPKDTSLWPIAADEPRWRLSVAGSDVAFTGDGRELVVAEADGATRVRGAADGEVVETLDRGGGRPLRRVDVSADGRRVLAVDADGALRVWARGAGGERPELLAERPRAIADAAFGPGELVAEARDDGRVAVADLAAAGAVRTASVGAPQLASVAWSGDGRLLLVAGQDGRATVLDAGRLRPVGSFVGSGEGLSDAAFAGGDRLVALAGDDPNVVIHRCGVCGTADQLMALADSLAARSLTAEERRRYLHEPR